MKSWQERASVGMLKDINAYGCRVRCYANRLAITPIDGRILSWAELQTIKESFWPGDVAVEVYPREEDVVNLWNTRHLWRGTMLSDSVESECNHPEFDI